MGWDFEENDLSILHQRYMNTYTTTHVSLSCYAAESIGMRRLDIADQPENGSDASVRSHDLDLQCEVQ